MMTEKKTKRLGELLIEAGFISQEKLQYCLDKQHKGGKKIGAIIIQEGLVKEKEIMKVLEMQMGIQYLDLDKLQIDPEVPKLITETMARRNNLIPFKVEGKKLFVAMINPLDILALDDVRISTGLKVEPFGAAQQDILQAIDKFYRKQTTEKAMEEFHKQCEIEALPSDDLDEEALLKINNAPIVRFVDSVINQAITAKASDIHIEPYEKTVRIRFRMDGDLQEVITPEKTSHSAIITRIKIMGRMDIAEKRIPQDGRVNYTVANRSVDMRVSILPTAYGEKAVIRLLDSGTALLTKQQLGFNAYSLEIFNRLIQYPYGIILVTGPTGSGKSTTLYSIIRELNIPKCNIVTVEDPIEYHMEGINQVQVNNKAGMTFANGLRAILRQDPDIIMIGEIRDAETAQISVRAAITGHLVLSTIHTNDTASTVTRLVDMGIDPYLISSALVGIMAQRLIKKICQECKGSYTASPAEKKILKIPETQELRLYKSEGCPACNQTGYKGRTCIVEIMPVTRSIKELINKGATIENIRERSLEEGMIALRQNAIELVLQGVTTVEELLRATYTIE